MGRLRLLFALLAAAVAAVAGAASVDADGSLAADISPSPAQSLAHLRQSWRALSLRPDNRKSRR